MTDKLLEAFQPLKPLRLPADTAPTLVVVIDTEEEFDWTAPFDSQATATTNIELQTGAQTILDRYGIVPTYVVDYPVANTATAVVVLQRIADRGGCEIGAHLHPWVTPPLLEPLNARHSYPGNLSPALEREKLSVLSTKIAASFGLRPTIYKAGRYGLGSSTFQTLAELGFRIDVSVVPYADFSSDGGPDFTGFPSVPFEGPHRIVAMPLSVRFTGLLAECGPRAYSILTTSLGQRLHLPGLLSRLGLLDQLRLSPEGHSVNELIRQVRTGITAGERYFMLTYHSSSLLPGATWYVRNSLERDRFLQTLDRFFNEFFGFCGGRTIRVTELAHLLAMQRSD